MANGEENAISVKVVLLGEAGVGKTCIISRFVNNLFEENVMSTSGANYAGKSVIFEEYEGKCLKFEIWDTAGQEKFRSITKIFYKDAKIAILVYDITRRDTFEQLKEFWHQQIKESAIPDIILGIAANKCDLYDDEEVKEEEGRQFASEIGAVFMLTSASTNAGIEELFKKVVSKFLDENSSNDTYGNNNNTNSNVKISGKEKKKAKKCC